ncbi:MAG TPA: chromosome segregation protein SMC [Bryobacteraceae bacterium]|nr:chromosome segregation protein SMC [Bryobacteraceae bacterium]
MLKLKRVEIQGFKSFYDRTEMKFNGSGIAAVVGPNGCGKSNLSDAISWVLGEQSAKSLRGARMEDVIFAGTRDRKPLGMASVTMTLVPDRAALAAATVMSPAGATHPDEKEVEPESAAPEPSPGDETTAVIEGTEHPAPLNGVNALNGVNGHHANGVAVHAPVTSDADRTAERSGEITITRRLYRSGESEYLINGKSTRLRDIQDLFFGTGLGPESYAIIEQGRIGQILSNRPQDRRAVIEEAAGITKFKARKRLAEAKLESAKQNLARVFDILEEVTRQVNSLKRQAAKTKRYGELKSEATGYLRQVLTVRFRLLEREMAKVAIELNLASTELQAAQTTVAEREAGQTKIIEESYAVEQELTAARKVLADLQLEAERARGKVEYQTTQILEIENRLVSGERDAQSLAQQQQERAAELEQHAAELQTIEAEFSAARQQLDAKLAEREQVQRRLSEHERELESSRQSVLRLLGESSGLKNRITQMEAQLGSHDRDTARAKNEEQQSESDLARIQSARAQLSDRLSARQTELLSVTDQRKEVEQELQQKRAALQENRHNLERVRSEFSRVKARKDSLDDVLQHRSYTTETVKRLFTAIESGKVNDLQPVGVLADFLEVDPQVEKAAEEFLHDELEYVVVRNWSDGERGVELMRTDLNGRATFLVEEGAAPLEPDTELPALASEAGVLMKLTDALRFTNSLLNIPLHTLPRIANCYVVEDRRLARDLAERFAQCWFLTPEGVNYHGRAVSGGKKTGAGPLALKRELRELAKVEEEKHRELQAAQAALVELERDIQKLTEHLERLRTKQQAQEKDVLALDHESRKLAEELQRVQSRLSRARLDLERLSKDRMHTESELGTQREALQVSEDKRAQQEKSLEVAREELNGIRSELAKATEEHAGLRAQVASLDERRKSITSQRARLENQVRDFQNRRNHLEHETQRLISDKAQFEKSNAELAAKSATLIQDIAATEKQVSTLIERETELRTRLAAAEEELKRLRSEAQTVQEKRLELQVGFARSESDMRHLMETCEKELETSLPELAATVETVPDETAVSDLDSKYMEVRRKIEALGPVNPQALEEYEEAQHRQDFLSAQRQDLLDSIRDTERAIHQIDGESRKRFAEAFHVINENFRNMFSTLFGGGIGEMRLTDEENAAESGIDIVASPPGKKLQSVLLLSGGEKSLTAMALLMGIFQYTPSPFCILDEVDAPLDEPNIERLTRLLKELAEQTQFIIITHAKRTMEAAQSLYGVTMQEPGISRLVSVKFKAPADGRQTASRPTPVREEDLQPAIA